jgi:pilus assembly protein CpaB
MKPKTMILMVVAVACGLGASYMTSKFLTAGAAAAPAEEMVPVLMAKVKVPGWTSIKDPEKYFEVKMLPESAVSKSSLKSFADVKDQRFNKPIEAERVAMQGDLLSKEQQSLADGLAPGMRAIAVKVNAESATAGFVLPGSRVDVVVTTRNNDPTAKVFLQGMLVLAVDAQKDRNPEQPNIQGQTVTLAATPEEATRLSLAGTIGELRLLPKSHGDNKRISTVVTRIADLDKPLQPSEGAKESDQPKEVPSVVSSLPEVGGTEKEQPKETGDVPAPAEKPQKRHKMTIINGTAKTTHFFVEGETEDGDEAPAPVKKEEKPETKPEVKKEEPAAKPTTPAAPTATTKTPRTRKS